MTTEQSKTLEVLREFQRICKKHQLKYYAIGGTCLGAIRHNGFIPWDDDIDIAMPVEDYHMFFKIAVQELKPEYGVVGPYTCQHYSDLYNKVQDKTTTFIEELAKRYPDRYLGAYIDVFPIAGLPTLEKERKQMINDLTLERRLNSKLRFPLSDCKSLRAKIAWLLCAPIRMCHSYTYYTDKQWELIDKYAYDESDMVLFPWRDKPSNKKTYKNVFYREDFMTPVEVPFEDGIVAVPNGYERYLTMDFGDYMKLPPVEQRITRHPTAVIDFEKPYSYYAEKYMREGTLK